MDMIVKRVSDWSADATITLDAGSHWLAIGLHKTDDMSRLLQSTSFLEPLRAFIPPKAEAPTGVGESLAVYAPADRQLPSILFYGLGDPATAGVLGSFESASAAARKLASKPGRHVTVIVPEHLDAVAHVRGWVVGTVGPGLKKKEASRHPFVTLTFCDPASRMDETDLHKAERVGHYVNLARTLGNMTPDDKHPQRFAQLAETVGRKAGCTVEIWDERKIAEERFGGLVGVAAGSTRPPRFVILKYQGAPEDTTHVAVVGKGVTFDSGGLSLKPSASMEDMKSDMTGAAVALATITALAELGAKVNVTAYLPLTENMTGGLATKLGDVLTMRDGTTVEILNTDAEGRLILADALAYAVEQKPTAIVDLATLTGACVVALGTRIAGLFSNDDTVSARLIESAGKVGERLWRLPIDDDFKEQIKSPVADLKNVGSRWGGAITASKFLQHFVGDTPWAHLDIAGPSWSDSESATRDAGGTGCYVATLVEWLMK